MPNRFPIHHRPNESVLEPLREEIVAMRKSRWPYRKISEWLRVEKGIQISYEGVRKFCLVRKIRKRPTPLARSDQRAQPVDQHDVVSQPQESGKLFSYDDSKPIDVRKQ